MPSTQRPELALFDFDGTLTTCETFPAFIKCVLPKSRLRAGWLRLWPLVLGYRLRLVSGTRLRAAIVRLAFAGASADALAEAGQRFATEFLPSVLRPQLLQRLAWHRQRGHHVLVVSGGLGPYLRPWAAAQGLEILCSELKVVDGRCTGRFAGEQCVGPEKARRICERLDVASYAKVYAYGDTPEDRAMLAIADLRWYRGRWLGAAALAAEGP